MVEVFPKWQDTFTYLWKWSDQEPRIFWTVQDVTKPTWNRRRHREDDKDLFNLQSKSYEIFWTLSRWHNEKTWRYRRSFQKRWLEKHSRPFPKKEILGPSFFNYQSIQIPIQWRKQSKKTSFSFQNKIK